MEEAKLNKMVIKIEGVVANEELADGLTILSASLGHAIILSIQNGKFDRSKLHDFFEELESRIMSSTRDSANAFKKNANVGIKRMD